MRKRNWKEESSPNDPPERDLLETLGGSLNMAFGITSGPRKLGVSLMLVESCFHPDRRHLGRKFQVFTFAGFGGRQGAEGRAESSLQTGASLT